MEELKKDIEKCCNNKCFVAGLIILVPFIFILVLKFIYTYVPGEEIGKPGDWISFAGGYLGVIGAVCIVWYQMKKEERDEIRGLLCYIKDILEYNKNNYTLEYMKVINNQAISIIWIKNKTYFEIKLKDLKLTKSDILLLYKHNYRNLVKMEDKLKYAINSYYFTPAEENIFIEIEKFIEKNKKSDLLILQLENILSILVNVSNFFYYSSFEKVNIKKINDNIRNLNKTVILKFIEKKGNLNNFDKNYLFYFVENNGNYQNIKKIYMIYLNLFYEIVINYNLDFGIILAKIMNKKSYLFSKDYENLISEISEEYEKLEKILK